MCGICGIIYDDDRQRVDLGVLHAMTACMSHRGPDDEGTYVAPDGGAALGHRRLAIIDPAGGKQPLLNETGGIALAANGEIYNFQTLRNELQQSGHRFATRTDSEVILHLYEEHGVDCVSQLRGMFAFALWDDTAKKLLLARDRLGQKPLFWHWDGQVLVFASSIESILKFPGITREIDPAAVDLFLAYQYIPPPRTIFKGINKLPPGNILSFENQSGNARPVVSEYWRPRMQIAEGRSIDDWCGELRERLTESVRLRLVSDVPLGAFLSGGIDSSIVTGLMAKLTNEPVKTFSIGFADRRYDETSYAADVAKHFHTDHRQQTVEPQALVGARHCPCPTVRGGDSAPPLQVLPKLVRHFGEPFGDSSVIPTFYLSEATRRHVKVALTGDGGDELFIGYPRYTAMKLARLLNSLPLVGRVAASGIWQRLPVSVEQKTLLRRLKKFSGELRLPPARRYFNWIAIFTDEQRRNLYESDFAEGVAAAFENPPDDGEIDYRHAGAFDRLLKGFESAGISDDCGAAAYADLLTYLPGDILAKVDTAAMSVGLEPRSPLLDHQFVEFVLTIPPELKLRGFTGKYLLKRAFRDMLPPQTISRRKMGFGVPISSWFRRELADYIRRVLLEPRALARKRFKSDVVRELVESHIAGRADNGYQIWNLLVLELWEREFME